MFDPAAQGCSACPANLLLVADAPGLWHALGQVGTRADGGLDGGVRPARTRPVPPRVAGAAPVVGSGPRARQSRPCCCGAPTPCTGSDRGFVSNDPTDRALRLAEAVALALVAAGVALARLRARRTRAALAQLVLDIGAAPAAGEVRAWLADALGDPTIALLYRLEGGEWIDAEGRETTLSPPGDGRPTRVRVAGQDVFAVVHRRGLLDDPTLLSELVTTASLALEHDRLHAACRARLEQLRASRARIVAEADSGAASSSVTCTTGLSSVWSRLPWPSGSLGAGSRRPTPSWRRAWPKRRPVCVPPWWHSAMSPTACSRLCSPRRAWPLPWRSSPSRCRGSCRARCRPVAFPARSSRRRTSPTVESLLETDRDVTVDAVTEHGRLTLAIGAGEQTTAPWCRSRTG